ncbi:uncharacterized protein [Lolium perenne]|uniref:uncharacterized protein n=1 Tax=Lolium perenne TaxID=4522 RepID=UPI0021EB3DC8|nr:transcription repressor OFP8-like [Lolium perenne]
MILRRRGSSGGLRIKKKGRGFMCGCGGSKAVSVSDGGSDDKQSPMATPPTNTSTATTMSIATTATTTTRRAAGNSSKSASMISSAAAAASSSFSPSSTDDADTSVGSTPSVAALLRQLGELERTVRSLQGHTAENVGGGGRGRHRRTASEGGARRIEESVAVVKESADPLADFRRSMLQMIVEKEIVGGDELRELLHRFLSLNAPHHHHLILRAFAEIWEEVFSGYDRTPDFLVSHPRSGKRRLHLPREPAAAVSPLR